jgi:hypothetical protein
LWTRNKISLSIKYLVGHEKDKIRIQNEYRKKKNKVTRAKNNKKGERSLSDDSVKKN